MSKSTDWLIQAGVSQAEARELRRYRRFYLTSPRIREMLSPELAGKLLSQTDTGSFRESQTPTVGVAAGEIKAEINPNARASRAFSREAVQSEGSCRPWFRSHSWYSF